MSNNELARDDPLDCAENISCSLLVTSPVNQVLSNNFLLFHEQTSKLKSHKGKPQKEELPPFETL